MFTAYRSDNSMPLASVAAVDAYAAAADPDLFALSDDIEVTPLADSRAVQMDGAVAEVGKGVFYLAAAALVIVGAFFVWKAAKEA